MNDWVLCFTTTSTAPTSVEKFTAKKINEEMYINGNSIDELFEMSFDKKKMKNPVFYCENLTVQGNFIFYHLLKNGFTFERELKNCTDYTFNSLINTENEVFNIIVYLKKSKSKTIKVTFIDFQKLVKFDKIEELAKTFDINFNSDDDVLKTKVDVISESYKKLFEIIETKKNTIGNCSLTDYKNFISEKCFKIWFPKLDMETDGKIRMCFKGGFTYCNPDYSNKILKNIKGMVLDVNSLYPHIMHSFPLPFGNPLHFQGQYVYNSEYPLFIQNFRCFFKLKQNHIPTIQIKHQLKNYSYTELLRNSNGLTYLSLTSVELELFLQNYEVFNIEYIDGYMFKSSTLMFKNWIEKWYELKTNADDTGNIGMRSITKLLLNNLYGKFATNPVTKNKFPYINNDDIVNYEMNKTPLLDDNGNLLFNNYTGELLETDVNFIDPIYIPVAVFITAWGRYVTINTAQKIHLESIEKTGKSRFIYADTDSIHLTGFDLPNLEIDKNKLGAWKIENTFKYAKYLANKRYIQILENGNIKVICAGMPDTCKSDVTFKNFKIGGKFKIKKYKAVQGGMILTNEFFTL